MSSGIGQIVRSLLNGFIKTLGLFDSFTVFGLHRMDRMPWYHFGQFRVHGRLKKLNVEVAKFFNLGFINPLSNQCLLHGSHFGRRHVLQQLMELFSYCIQSFTVMDTQHNILESLYSLLTSHNVWLIFSTWIHNSYRIV